MTSNTDLRIDFFPTENDLCKIKLWLYEEDKKFKEGFYCNWGVIENAYKEEKIIILHFQNETVGFLVWREDGICIEIDILEIRRDYRKKGIGKYFFNNVLEFFKKKGFIVAKLFCSPIDSEKFWRKIGFLKFPDRGYSESDLTFYKPLIEVEESTAAPSHLNKLELWDLEPYQIINEKPKWSWNIESGSNKLLKPIIQPCNYNWNLRWTKNGKVIREGKVKYFSTEDNLITFNPFVFVKELIE